MSWKQQPEDGTKGRGGYRENAGRKSSWKHRDTCTIRIPKPFAMQLVELARRLDNGEKIDTDTESNFRENDLVTESNLAAQPESSGKLDTGTESKLPLQDSVTKSLERSEALMCQLAHQSELGERFDIDTESKPQSHDIVTKSETVSEDETLSQSIPDLKQAIAQAKNILKAKKSARRSLAQLLSTLYSTTVSFDDLK